MGEIHQIIRAEEAPRFIYGGKARANLFAVVPLLCIPVSIFFMNC
jgi:hypothetical protein